MSLKGELFIYDENRNLTAFESGHVGSTKSVIIIGGLGDGFMTIPYTAWLSQALSGLSISLIQVLLSSSYSAYGKESLSSDTQDLTLLLDYLCKKRGKQQIILLGHSTGCQDIMWLAGQNSNYLKLSELVQSCIRGAILQASVSDREYYFGPNGMAEAGELLEWAKKSSNTDVFLKLVGNVSFTAYRVKALLERL